MPTISELPVATAVDAADQIPLSQGGASRSTTVAALLADMQPAVRVNHGTLLGRTSVGAGGPEEVVIGPGLVMTNGTLEAANGLLNSFDTAASLAPDDSLVIHRHGRLHLVPVTAIRALYSAGQHVTIDGQGTIAAVWPSGAETGSVQTADIGALPRSLVLQASDLIPIQRGTVSHATSYSTLLNAQTIDQAAPAQAASDSDQIWVAQSDAMMVRQSFSAIWNWISSNLPTARVPTVEIETNVSLDTTVHNGHILVCTQPIEIIAPILNMGAGFHCEIINMSAGQISFGPGIVTSAGSTSLPPRRAAQLRVLALASGNVVYANIQASGPAPTLPGAVQGLVIGEVLATTARLSWVAPATGAPPFTFNILYRVSGATTWLPGPVDINDTTGMVSTLTPGTSYEFVVTAANAAGLGNMSVVVSATTQAVASIPGQPIGLAAATQGPNSVALSWAAPPSGGTVRDYYVQYRSSGSTLWNNGPSNITSTNVVVSSLIASTTYEFRTFAVNASGAGPASAAVSATTQPLAGIVTAIQWNMAPVGPYTHGNGAIGVNVLVTPADGPVRLGFSTSASTPPSTWTLAVHVMTNLWGAYVDTPMTPGTWYAWAQGTDGSANTVYSTSFVVQ